MIINFYKKLKNFDYYSYLSSNLKKISFFTYVSTYIKNLQHTFSQNYKKISDYFYVSSKIEPTKELEKINEVQKKSLDVGCQTDYNVIDDKIDQNEIYTFSNSPLDNQEFILDLIEKEKWSELESNIDRIKNSHPFQLEIAELLAKKNSAFLIAKWEIFDLSITEKTKIYPLCKNYPLELINIARSFKGKLLKSYIENITTLAENHPNVIATNISDWNLPEAVRYIFAEKLIEKNKTEIFLENFEKFSFSELNLLTLTYKIVRQKEHSLISNYIEKFKFSPWTNFCYQSELEKTLATSAQIR